MTQAEFDNSAWMTRWVSPRSALDAERGVRAWNQWEDIMVDRYRSASPYEGLVGFSRAVRRGPRIIVSGTAPIGADGETVVGDAYTQATRCFEVILEAVEALGGAREDVVRTRMYVVDAADWDAVSRAHGETFGSVFPAATMVVVKELLDPKWLVEIEAEAIVGD